MGDAAHLRVRGGVTVILWRQEGTRMQALTCTAQQVSGEKMGSCAPAKAQTDIAFWRAGAAPVHKCGPVASRPFPRGPVWRFWIGATAGEQWHQPCPYHTTMLVGGRRAWNGNVETPLTLYYFPYTYTYLYLPLHPFIHPFIHLYTFPSHTPSHLSTPFNSYSFFPHRHVCLILPTV